MGRHVDGKARAGSRKWLQVLVNDHTELLNFCITPKLRPRPENIEWLSPLRQDDYAEYSDDDFLRQLGAVLDGRKLGDFWPDRGPHWDALGRTDEGQILLVEAKSHVREMLSTLKARDPVSRQKICSSLSETKWYIGSRSGDEKDWTTGVYQYANRLAHLYFLNQLNNEKAFLVLLCFLNDTERRKPDTHVPTTAAEWEAVIAYQERLMGIRQRHPLTDSMVHVFIDVRDIEANK